MTRITATLHADRSCTFMLVFRSVLPIITNTSEKVVEKIKSQNVISLTFYQKSCRL
jgi:hypothetical protein